MDYNYIVFFVTYLVYVFLCEGQRLTSDIFSITILLFKTDFYF